jgi:hypothetical protein
VNIGKAHPSLMGTKSREILYGASARASAERAAEARRTADQLAYAAWNKRMLALVALTAVPIFSLTISRASRRAARLPPSMSFIIRRAMTPFASTANLVREFNIAQ